MAIDISAQGARVVFKGGLNLVVSEFSDEGTPFECSDVDISTNAKNLNGEMISSRTPSLYTFSITVIPNSVADYKLAAFFQKQLLQPGQNNANSVNSSWYCDATITLPQAYEGPGINGSIMRGSPFNVTFSNCRPKSCPIGLSTSAEGRMSARTYTFEAESVNF